MPTEGVKDPPSVCPTASATASSSLLSPPPHAAVMKSRKNIISVSAARVAAAAMRRELRVAFWIALQNDRNQASSSRSAADAGRAEGAEKRGPEMCVCVL